MTSLLKRTTLQEPQRSENDAVRRVYEIEEDKKRLEDDRTEDQNRRDEEARRYERKMEMMIVFMSPAGGKNYIPAVQIVLAYSQSISQKRVVLYIIVRPVCGEGLVDSSHPCSKTEQ